MDTRDVLLGRPSINDKKEIHRMRDNTNTFVKDGKVITLYPMNRNHKKGLRPSVTRESLQLQHVYNSNVNKTQVRGQTLLQPGGNDAKPVGQRN